VYEPGGTGNLPAAPVARRYTTPPTRLTSTTRPENKDVWPSLAQIPPLRSRIELFDMVSSPTVVCRSSANIPTGSQDGVRDEAGHIYKFDVPGRALVARFLEQRQCSLSHSVTDLTRCPAATPLSGTRWVVVDRDSEKAVVIAPPARVPCCATKRCFLGV
jgi:hypothetical protein